MRVSFLFAECACGEAHPSALVDVDGEIICGNCEAHRRDRPEAVCGFCGQRAPFENHHPDREADPDGTMNACINCHRKHHVGRKRTGK